MRVLLTNNTLDWRAGSEAYLRDVAIELLRRGHAPVAYSNRLGPMAEDLRAATIPVVDDLSQLMTVPDVESAIEHIAVAQSVDALVIAPATANVIAKMAHGLADDFLTTLYLATKAPVIVAPAMNVNMWENPATQENLEVLRRRGVKVVDPDAGYLACGMVGPGRLASVRKSLWKILVGRTGLTLFAV